MNGKNKKTPYAIFLVALCLVIAGCAGGGGEIAVEHDHDDHADHAHDHEDGEAQKEAEETTNLNTEPIPETKESKKSENPMMPPMGDPSKMNPEDMKKMGESRGMSMQDMMKMGESMGMSKENMMKMGESMGSSHSGSSQETPPKLQNLMIKNLGPWDPTTSTFGDLKFNSNYQTAGGNTIFDDFGMIHDRGSPTQYDNPTFEFKAPADTVVIAPISGVVTMINFQPTTSYKQDDWELIIASSQRAAWGVNLDHISSIDCDRSGANPVDCDLPLTINGEIIKEGTTIEAGQVLGYVGNWQDTTNSGINGRTELTVFEYIRDDSKRGENLGVRNHCPTMYLDESVELLYKSKIQDLMNSFETWSGDSSNYPQEQMVSPGCRYTAIEETPEGKTTPVTG